MRHYKLQVLASNKTFQDSAFFPPGFFGSGKEYLEHAIQVVRIDPLLNLKYRLVRFSETGEEWFAIAHGSFDQILQDFCVVDLSSNIVEIET